MANYGSSGFVAALIAAAAGCNREAETAAARMRPADVFSAGGAARCEARLAAVQAAPAGGAARSQLVLDLVLGVERDARAARA